MGNILRRSHWAALAAALATAGAPALAQASVALCELSLSGEIAEDGNEAVARKRALDSWVGHARRLGEQYTRWGIAWNRRIDCSPLEHGGFRCQASGQPCTIQHVPPAGITPLKRSTDG